MTPWKLVWAPMGSCSGTHLGPNLGWMSLTICEVGVFAVHLVDEEEAGQLASWPFPGQLGADLDAGLALMTMSALADAHTAR